MYIGYKYIYAGSPARCRLVYIDGGRRTSEERFLYAVARFRIAALAIVWGFDGSMAIVVCVFFFYSFRCGRMSRIKD